MNEIQRTFESIQLNLLFSYIIYLLIHLNASQFCVDEKQDFQIRCTGMESRFLLEATFIHLKQHFPVCLTKFTAAGQ